MIYLDHRSSAPLWPTVLTCMHDAAQCGGNPSSLHGLGRQARRCVEDATDALRVLLNTGKAEIVFTGSGNEANALGVLGLARARRASSGQGAVFLGSACAAAELLADGFDVRRFDPSAQVPQVTPDIAVVAVSLDDDTTGALNPVHAIAAQCALAGVPLHCDATRAAPVVPVDFADLGATTLAICGPRMGGPAGTGALVVTKASTLSPLWGGGGQQNNWRSGTPAVAAIAGFGEAARCTQSALAQPHQLVALRGSLQAQLAPLAPQLRVLNTDIECLPNVAHVFAESRSAEAWLEVLSQANIMASQNNGTLCLSLGWSTRAADIAHVATAFEQNMKRAAA